MEADERLLRAIPGVLTIAQHGPGDPVGPLLVALDQEIEGSRFLRSDRTAQLFIARLHGRLWPRSSHTRARGTNSPRRRVGGVPLGYRPRRTATSRRSSRRSWRSSRTSWRRSPRSSRSSCRSCRRSPTSWRRSRRSSRRSCRACRTACGSPDPYASRSSRRSPRSSRRSSRISRLSWRISRRSRRSSETSLRISCADAAVPSSPIVRPVAARTRPSAETVQSSVYPPGFKDILRVDPRSPAFTG